MENRLVLENIELLRQSLDLLDRIDNGLYRTSVAAVSPSPVGSHLRHCLDFYRNFLTGHAVGRIDYDVRERNEAIALDRSVARIRIVETIDGLERLLRSNDRARLLVKLEGNGEDLLAWSWSSVKRELQFLLSHTIHHFALIAILLRLQGYEPGVEFGVAPSTLIDWRKSS